MLLRICASVSALLLVLGSATAKPCSSKHETAAGKNIVEVAQSAKIFTTLITAAKAAGLVDTLVSPGPLTVFAPTDEAFAKLPKGTVEKLLEPENKHMLAEILKYHVVSGKITARDAVTAGHAKTAQGGTVNVTIVDGRLLINNATVVKSDVGASNGVIHVIDTVLLPKKK